MLIASYMVIVTVVIPKCLVYLAVLFESAMIWFIMGAGMLMLLSAVGVRISNNMGSTIVVGIIMAIGFIVRTLVQALGWILRNMIIIAMPTVFRSSRRAFLRSGMNGILANILAIVVMIAFAAVII